MRFGAQIPLRVILVIWLLLVIAVSVTPLSFKLKLHTIGTYHDLGHYVVYTLTGVFLWLSVQSWVSRIGAFAFGFALSLGQEWAENRLYHAGYEWKDVSTDAAGLITALVLMLLLTRIKSSPSRLGR